MIPSLVAGEVRRALVDYLATTFSLSDDDVRGALASFLSDPADGVFRGPYLRVRTPFRPVGSDWSSPLGWLPEGLVPYVHQAAAFERLSTLAGRQPEPTLVTTGTGSGKTECFLLPILDHCARQLDAGHSGVKALILYPMNALASDQAGRLADLIATDPRLTGISAGLYLGDNGSHSTMGSDHLIDDRYALRTSPPDILLTNYKMLDFLLLRREDHDLWSANQPDTLRYVVLDELHTYDGAQGTDVAMLLRRLGATLGMAQPGKPLGAAAPVATSATMGSEKSASADLRAFATKLFGTDIPDEAVLGETRQTIDEACGPVDYDLIIPSVDEVLEVDEDDHEALAYVFCRRLGVADDAPPATPIELGVRLLAHPLTRAVLAAVGDRVRTVDDAVVEIVARAPDWGRVAQAEPERVAVAVSRYLALLSVARRQVGTRVAPLLPVEVQLWVREISRLLRGVGAPTTFRWADSPVSAALPADPSSAAGPARSVDGGLTVDLDDHDSPEVIEAIHDLPAVYCRKCGHAGWMTLRSEVHDNFSTNSGAIYRGAFDRQPNVRVLLRAHPDDPAALWLDPISLRIGTEPRGCLAVYVTDNDDDGRGQRCPACNELDAIRFIGLAVASLASVTVNTLFGSDNVDVEERKLLAFTDSVQDASHRAAFFTGRTHRFNMRALMSATLQDHADSGLDLASLGDVVMDTAVTATERFGLVPPDLIRDNRVRPVWSDEPTDASLGILRDRVGFEIDLEFGLRSRVGRTLEQSVAAASGVAWDDLEMAVGLAREAVQDVLGEVPERVDRGLEGYVLGIGERLRTSGGLFNTLLDPYVHDGGKQWFVWGGRPVGLPPFAQGQGRPVFATTARVSDFDSLTSVGKTPTWYLDWAARSLGLPAADAQAVNVRVLETLANATDMVRLVKDDRANNVIGLDRRFVRAVDIGSLDSPVLVRCETCGTVDTVLPAMHDRWIGVPCRRYRCPGHLVAKAINEQDGGYYRRFYRQGKPRRVVAAEHTGLLKRAEREALEQAFKAGTAPDAPNVLTATPTLEMGIDIGDLSAVMLTSVPRNPASYIQRVGRAGRATGNALVTTFVRSDTHGLYYLAEPEAMLAGAVRPPSCYLDATETLERQYVAFLLDRIAEGEIEAPAIPYKIGMVLKSAFDEHGLFTALITASTGGDGHAERFLDLFGDQLGQRAADSLRHFAANGIAHQLKEAADTWFTQRKELDRRRDRLNTAIEKLEGKANRDEGDEDEFRSLKGQRAAVVRLLQALRDEYTLSALERMGVLPNYTLVDDTVELNATMWSRDGDDLSTETVTYARGASVAIREFAPGNTFYVGGHRHLIDALEIGAADAPLYEAWRICPECSYADLEVEGQPLATCPRCQRAGIADVGSRHQVLRLRTAMASGSEESSRVGDESDERTRESFEVITLVDPLPSDISGAWVIQEQTFGAELCHSTRLRTFNLGRTDGPGETVPLAGEPTKVSGFNVCRHCGAVKEARNDYGGRRPARLHQGWCKVRSGSVAEHWDPIVLLQELTTESIRFVVPVSMFEVDERLVSFKAALLLGIREHLGGNPEHLTIATADSPNLSGDGRRRFLVLFDRVPGGTGYLGPLADPQQVRLVLEKGRELIARCPCRTEGRPACHRCLLGVVDRWEYELARRDLAKDLLDALLEDWNPVSVATVGDISIAPVEESELERRFKVALRAWVDSRPAGDRTYAFTRVPSKGKYDSFELTISEGVDVKRYRIDEQPGVLTTPNTVPDFLISRMDAGGPEIAVYLDGFQYHASSEHNSIAGDAQKRSGLRASGRLVWNLSWEDVSRFHDAVASEPPREPPHRAMLDTSAKHTAQNVQHQRDGLIEVKEVERNALDLLLFRLAAPDDADWKRLCRSVVAGLASTGEQAHVDAAGLTAALDAALAGAPMGALSPADDPIAMVSTVTTANGLRLVFVLDLQDPNAERWTAFAVLPDASGAIVDSEHKARWTDWLAWSNVLQFLGLPYESTGAVIAASSQAESGDHDDLWLRHVARGDSTGELVPSNVSGAERVAVAGGRPASKPELTPEQADELDLMDSDVRSLVEWVLGDGAPTIVTGFETEDGLVIEAAFPEQRIGVLVTPEDPVPAGWDARPVSAWTIEALRDLLQKES